jgi:hypothetical protein
LSSESDAPSGKKIKSSDGNFFVPVVFTPHLQHIASKVSIGDIVILCNYIAQPISCNDVVLFCLHVSVMGASQPIIGDPLDYKVINACNVQRDDVSAEGKAFVSVVTEGFVRNVVEIPATGHSMVEL